MFKGDDAETRCMWKYAMSAAAAVVVIGAGVIGSIIGAATILGQAAVAISMSVALLTVALVVAYGWGGPFRTRTEYW